MQGRNCAAAGSKHKRNAGQHIHNRINDIDGSQCICSDIGRNENTVNNGIDGVKQRGQIGRNDKFQKLSETHLFFRGKNQRVFHNSFLLLLS